MSRMTTVMRRRALRALVLALFATLSARPCQADDQPALEADYVASARPLVERYCHDCHSGDAAEGDLDLTHFATVDDIRRATRAWQRVDEMLASGQMPPPDAVQPSDDERRTLTNWVHEFLVAEAQARAGDPGRVVLRRLGNAEYTYTLRDLTGVDTLEPALEFPADGAAGEGFTNTGAALAMSPELVAKYLDAAKRVAQHAVLLPDGFRFSPHATSSDWTNDALASIRELYSRHTDSSGGSTVNVQGIVFDTNGGGRLPLRGFLAATLAERDALTSGQKSTAAVAAERGLNAKYLDRLWSELAADDASQMLAELQRRWRVAGPDDVEAVAVDIERWQAALWRFATVGHIGKVGGPKRWLEPVNPLTNGQELRLPLPESSGGEDVVVSLVVGDAGDGAIEDVVLLRGLRLSASGRPDILVKDVRALSRDLAVRRALLAKDAAACLRAVDEAQSQPQADVGEIAARHGVDAAVLQAWLAFLGVGENGVVEIRDHLSGHLKNVGGHDFVQGWGSGETPNLVANASDMHVRVPGNLKPRGVAVHPSPTLRIAVGWQSPVAATVRIDAAVAHAHPECGNGVDWRLELRRGPVRQQLASGIAHGTSEIAVGPIDNVAVRPGDLVSLSIGPRDGNHSCDLTSVDLRVTSASDGAMQWNLAADVSADPLAGNPHADARGTAEIWHFFTEPEGGASGPVIAAGSTLARWQTAASAEARARLATEVQQLLADGMTADTSAPDAALYRELTSASGLLMRKLPTSGDAGEPHDETADADVGLDPKLFGHSLTGEPIDADSLCLAAPATLVLRLPAEMARGAELVADAQLAATSGEGSVQLRLVAGEENDAVGGLSPDAPVLVAADSAAQRRFAAAFDDFRALFPAALCYVKIVPVDEAVTLTLFHREDEHLARLMLGDADRAELDRLWSELHYVSRDALTLVDAFTQLLEYASQDGDPSQFEPLRGPIEARAAEFRQQLAASEPAHLRALVDFAARAYRRPLAEREAEELLGLYERLRGEELNHDEAFRLTLARVLVAPAFLYRLEEPPAGAAQAPVSDFELANRLSYFLWSSQPDNELMELAAAGRLSDPATLGEQTLRMLADARTRRLATEFACQWLHIYEFDRLDEKSERHFPTFAALRGPMYEESIRFFTDLFQNNGSALDIVDADYTFLNGPLAAHYGVPGVEGDDWRRVNGMKAHGRGGVLAHATTLAKQSGASRTSPILRGNWISEVLLGERLPRPPKGVPQLPDDEASAAGLSMRELVERHTSDAKCSVCHRRIDPLGFSLETFDAIGALRPGGGGASPVDTAVETIDGARFDGLDGLRDYLSETRRDAFVRQFCRKLLGFALGRTVQLSDEPLLAEIEARLAADDFRVHSAIMCIVQSRQFREIRGRDAAAEE